MAACGSRAAADHFLMVLRLALKREPFASLRVTSAPALQIGLVVVDLSALEFVGIVDVDGFPFGEEIDGGDGGFTMAIAGLLGAAKGEMSFCADGGCIDVDDAGVKIAKSGEGSVDVAGVHGSGQAVGDAVGDVNSLLEIVDGNHRNDGTEDFFLSDVHLGIAIGEDGGLVKPSFGVSAFVESMAAGE